MKKIFLIACMLTILAAVPVKAATQIYKGRELINLNAINEPWGISADRIEKITNSGNVFSIDDMANYSAHITNDKAFIGNSMEESFKWINKSRMTYLKLIKVTPGAKVSFVFDKEFYVDCAQYDSSFRLIDDGVWNSTGDVIMMTAKTEWIMLIFRQCTGNLEVGADQAVEISVNSFNKSKTRYVVFSPFKYTFKMNGGRYRNSTNDYLVNRYGVEKVVLPVPVRDGYIFKGWKTETGKIYSGTLKSEYNEALFKNVDFTAVWEPVVASGITLNKEYTILESGGEDYDVLTATIAPADTLNRKVVWRTENEAVAKVSQKGTVVAQGTGKTRISATCGNVTAYCTVYVMGFNVEIPAYCTLDKVYEIKINVVNNGLSNMTGRKHVKVNTANQVRLSRVGDTATTYNVKAYKSNAQNSGFSYLGTQNCLIDTVESTSIFYQLKSDTGIKKSGDYQGNINFSVVVT